MLAKVIDALITLISIKLADDKLKYNFLFEYSQCFDDFHSWLLASTGLVAAVSGSHTYFTSQMVNKEFSAMNKYIIISVRKLGVFIQF